MDPMEREELSELRREQQRLQGELAGLSRKLQDLEGRLGETDAAPAEEEEFKMPEPILGKPPAAEAEEIPEPAEAPRTTPPPVPESAKKPPPVPAEAPKPAATEQSPKVNFEQAAREAAAANVANQTKETKAAPPKPAGDWELNLGQVWFVRIGVGLLLTGLVFLSLYAYKNWIFNATALVKVSFFFAVSLVMVVGGYFIERRKEELRQYGQVLSAGGLAAGYYTLYAAHFVPALKVIGSPIAAAILLCLWAGGMLAYSAWRQGRILAVMSIGLAYYGTVMNPSGWISLFSSLVLSASAMFLLIRYRWVWVGLVGLVAAYLSHAFWATMMGHEVTEAVRITYLACTWLLFSVAMQVPQSQAVEQNLRRAMLGINNTAFWLLVVFHMPKMLPHDWLMPENLVLQAHEHIGWISLGIGVVWMLIGALTWTRGGWRREYVMLWGFQGLFIATLGLMIEASGYSRFMMLAAEACVLLAASRWMAPKWTKLAAILCFIGSMAFALLEGIEAFHEPRPGELAYFFTALFGFAFVILMRRDVSRCSQEHLAFYGDQHRFMPVMFAFFPWAMLIFGTLIRWEPEWTLIGLFGIPLALVGIRVLYERNETIDLPLLSPLAVLFGGGWLLQWDLDLPNWTFSISIAILALYWLLSEHLRRSYKSFHKDVPLLATPWVEWIASMVLTVLLFRWLITVESRDYAWLIAAPAIAVTGSLVYVLTRRYSLAILLGIFHIGAIIYLLGNSRHDGGLVASAAPMLGVILHLVLCEVRFKDAFRSTLRPWAGIGICMAFIGFLEAEGWSEPGIWVTLSSSAWLVYAFRVKQGAAAITGGLIPLIYLTLGYGLIEDADGWWAYLCLPVLPAAALMTARLQYNTFRSWKAFRWVGGVLGLFILGIKFGRHVHEVFDAGRAISWGLYAVILFAVGLVFADRLFRRFGLFYLLLAVLHILTVDVMKLDTLGRILSFIVMGAVLLLLGFLYNQYQDKIRKYL